MPAPDSRKDMIQLRRDSAADWAAVNPVLAFGEPGWDSTNQQIRVGDGVTAWKNLPVAATAPGSSTAMQLRTALPNWSNALQTGAANIVVLGDSISSLSSRSWPYVVEETLQQRWSSAAGSGATGWVHGKSANERTLTSADGGVLASTGAGAQSMSLPSASTATIVGTCDKVTVVWTRTPSGGSIVVRDGGPAGAIVGTINTAGATAYSQITDVTMPNLSKRTVHLTASSGAVLVEGLHLGAGTGPRVFNPSKSGETLASYLANTDRGLDLVSTMQPHLVIIALGHNDGATNYPTRIASMVSAVKTRCSAADVVVWIPWGTTSLKAAQLAQYRAAALATGCPVIDASIVGSAVGRTEFSGDGVHPTDTASRSLAVQVVAAIGTDSIGSNGAAVVNEANALVNIFATTIKSAQTWVDTGDAQPHTVIVNPGFWSLLLGTGTGIAFGPGGSTVPDSHITRVSAGALTINKGDGRLDAAGIRLKNLGAVPAGPNVVGDMVVVSGKVQVCTVAGSPGTWVVVGTQT